LRSTSTGYKHAMSNYRRCHEHGSPYFFTVVTYNRRRIFESESAVELLRSAFRTVMNKHPFTIDAMVVLPDHLHCIWQLPDDDTDFSTRWMLIKKQVSASMKSERNHRGEKEIWQRRFWEHLIRNDDDYHRHMDYIHYNPVKHGYVKSPAKWPFSSFRKMVTDDLYDANWGTSKPDTILDMNYE